MRFLLLFIGLSSLISTASLRYVTKGFIRNDYLKQLQVTPTSKTYKEVIAGIKRDRSSLLANQVSIDSCRTYFLDKFEKEVFPHWVGTTWDYNGYTNTPGPGKLIACGYFVSTPLKHMGFNWNRYDLAKMYSKNIVETVCADDTLYEDKKKMISDIRKKEDNLYIVGLDSHVGMILKRGSNVWFVHSNYYDIKGPDKEIAVISQALEDSYHYYLGTFLDDRNIKRWLNQSLIPTPR